MNIFRKRIISIIFLFFLCISVFYILSDSFLYEKFSNIDGKDMDDDNFYNINNNGSVILEQDINIKNNDGVILEQDNNIKNNDGGILEQDNNIKNNDVLDKDKTCEINTKCDIKNCGNNLHPILDPKYNMREASKQCLLLEDHLNNSKKRCIDCIKKHFLMVDGLLEEAVSLEKENNLREIYRNRYLEWVKLEKEYVNDIRNDKMDNISKKIRTFRKPLMEEYFDSVSEYSV